MYNCLECKIAFLLFKNIVQQMTYTIALNLSNFTLYFEYN